MEAKDIIKKLIFDVAVKAAIKQLVTSSFASPLFSIPVLGPICAYLAGWAIEWVADILYVEIARFVTFTIIDFKTEQERMLYENAVGNLKQVLADPEEKPEEKERAKELFKARLRDLIRLNG